MRIDILTVVLLKTQDIQDVKQGKLVNSPHYYEGAWYLHLQSQAQDNGTAIFQALDYLFTSCHGVTSQKT